MTVVFALLTTSACSWFGGGKKGDENAIDGVLSESDLANRYGSGSIPNAEGEGLLKDILFDYDSAAISDAARQGIEYNAQILQSNPSVSVKLEGHCDERGTAEYNMALSAERAKSVQDVLVSYGVSPSRLSTISYGEEIPLDAGHDEAAYARNRRVHFATSKVLR